MRDQAGYQNNFMTEAEKTQSAEVYDNVGLFALKSSLPVVSKEVFPSKRTTREVKTRVTVDFSEHVGAKCSEITGRGFTWIIHP